MTDKQAIRWWELRRVVYNYNALRRFSAVADGTVLELRSAGR